MPKAKQQDAVDAPAAEPLAHEPGNGGGRRRPDAEARASGKDKMAGKDHAEDNKQHVVDHKQAKDGAAKADKATSAGKAKAAEKGTAPEQDDKAPETDKVVPEKDKLVEGKLTVEGEPVLEDEPAEEVAAAEEVAPAEQVDHGEETAVEHKAAEHKAAEHKAGDKPKPAPRPAKAIPQPAKAIPQPAKAIPQPVESADEGPEKRALFLQHQGELLLAERNNYTRQAEELRAQAEALALEHEPGDVQFDEEGGEGGTANVDRELDLHLSAQAHAAIEEIDAALVKIEAGSYGYCESCGMPIPKARLEALPHARLCVTCKSGGLTARRQ